MIRVIILFFLMVAMTTSALSEEISTNELLKRIEALEKKQSTFIGPDIPTGFFVNGNVEAYYDEKTYDDSWDSRTVIVVGVEQDIDNDYINWAGGSSKWDSHYSFNTALNNTLVEKQIGFGNDTCRLYLGETDVQRLGYAKTPKISVPLIYTQNNYRIDHNEKSVLACGGYQWDNQFDFDSHRLKRERPFGLNIGYDRKQDTWYYTGTTSVFGLAEISYMRIDSPSRAPGYTEDKTQEGYAIGGTLHRFNVPLIWGVELWDDKDTGLAKDDRLDFGGLYTINNNLYTTFHRTVNDDLGYTGNYYGLVYNIYTDTNVHKRADKRDGLEFGIYYLHDKEQTNVYTASHTDYDDQIIASIRWKF